MNLELLGIHHVTAVTARARENLAFYTKTLGMRLVKKTVNQDDVRAYHLFYADAKGSPGTDLTFFDWSHAGKERFGSHSITRVSLRVPSAESLRRWVSFLEQKKVAHTGIVERDGREMIAFQDPEGLRLTLVRDDKSGDGNPWEYSPIPARFQIRGLGPVTITVPDLTPTDSVLTEVMRMRPVREYPDPDAPKYTVHVFEMGPGGAGAELHLQVRPDLPPAQPGAGGVHHVAFRVPNIDEHRAWAKRLDEFGLPNSGEIDRFYFRSLYFHEPNRVLFELATDGPGFATDEDPAHLGERLALPPFLENRRAAIEANLKPLS
ncbi:MAG: ring-cleaving dioxygenase [Chthoniobacterales bacterium]